MVKVMPESTRGYSQTRLQAVLVLAGNNPSAKALAKIVHLGDSSATRRYRDGEFTREQICRIVKTCRMTQHQLIKTFFDGMCVDDDDEIGDVIE